MRLLIAEKPSVAKDYKELLERVEGERFIQKHGYYESQNTWISWCVGHLVALTGPEEYGWKEWTLKDLPMIPREWKFEISQNTKDQFKVLRELMRNAAFIINGGDAGREGELIYRLVVQEAGCQGKPQWRLWLNSMAPADMTPQERIVIWPKS